jgi:hypothetical protein
MKLRHSLLVIGLLASGAARAGSVDDPGTVVAPPPVAPKPEPKVNVELSGGILALLGSNAKAFGAGPWGRFQATLAAEPSYEGHLALMFSEHALVDTGPLYRPTLAADASGHTELYTVSGGARAFPLADEKKATQAPLQPFVGSDIGITLASGTVVVSDAHLSTTTWTAHLYVDVAGGLEWRVHRNLSLGVVARIGALPAFRPPLTPDKKSRIEVLFLPSAGLTLGGHF